MNNTEIRYKTLLKLYRYELYADDEPQDVGFLVGIEDLGLSCEKEDRLLMPFDEELVNPILPEMVGSVSFFTEAGIKKFEDAIRDLAEAYEGSIFDVKQITLELPTELNEHIIYEDTYQVCLPMEIYKGKLDQLKVICDASKADGLSRE